MEDVKKMSETVLKKAKEGSEKSSAQAFSIPEDLYAKFKEKCEKEGVKMSKVIQEFLKEFVK